ncbi:MAG: hypothetical protein LBI15_00815 [Dysgonamonadaceae bacterium]|nr:hypothetical protein [Dysgonamonadaceae bacterium]
MKAKIKAYLTFYQSFCFTTIVISLLCGFFLFKNGISAYFALFMFKIITSGLIFYYM